MIPAEAVEAAARIIALSSQRYIPSDWDDRPDDWPFKEDYRNIARVALEAAAQFVERAAYDRGFDDGHRAGQESMEAD